MGFIYLRTFMSLTSYIKLAGMLVAFTSQAASADGYAIFSKHEELKAQVVADVGDIEKIDPPFDKLSETEILKLHSNCFQPTGSLGAWGYGKKAGLILVDRYKTIRVALIESSVGSIKVVTMPALQVACPAEGSSSLSIDPKQRLEELERQQELLKLQLESIRQLREQ